MPALPKKTKYSVVYLHGFTASGKEGDPVHKIIAKAFGANLYVPRLHGHGLEEEEPMLNFNNDDFWESGNKTARTLQLGMVRDIGDGVRKGFMKKVHRRPWCQD